MTIVSLIINTNNNLIYNNSLLTDYKPVYKSVYKSKAGKSDVKFHVSDVCSSLSMVSVTQQTFHSKPEGSLSPL